MTTLHLNRPMTGLAAGALSVALLAGCSADDDGDDNAQASPEPSSTSTESAPGDAPAAPEAPAPDPDASGESEVESLEGTLTAQIPNSWGPFPDEALEQVAQDPSMTDVLGAWVAGDSEDSQSQIAVMSQQQDPEVPGADEYYETYLTEVEEQVDLTHEIFDTANGDEVLFASIEADEDAGTPAESTFLLFSGDEMVVGTISAPGAIDDGLLEDFRAVADSISVA